MKRANQVHYQFTHKRGEEVVARYNATLRRKYSPTSERHLVDGIALTSKKMQMFYPRLIEDVPGSSYYIYIHSQPNQRLPPHQSHLYDVNMKTWPSSFQSGSFQFPNHLTFEYFRESTKNKTSATICDLEKDHECVGLTYLELYPGHNDFRSVGCLPFYKTLKHQLLLQQIRH